MLFAYALTAPKMVGTDMFHAPVLLWVAGTSHLLHGDVDKHAMAWLLVGSIPGVLIGSSLSIKVPERFTTGRLRDGARALGDQARRAAAILVALAGLLGAWLLRLMRLRRSAAQEAA